MHHGRRGGITYVPFDCDLLQVTRDLSVRGQQRVQRHTKHQERRGGVYSIRRTLVHEDSDTPVNSTESNRDARSDATEN